MAPELEMAHWFKLMRKDGLRLTQKQLSEQTGVPLGTIRHFERTGRIGLPAFMKLAAALSADHQLLALARCEEPETFFKIEKEKTISRLMDELKIAQGEVTPAEVTRRNTAIPPARFKQWRLASSDKWHTAVAAR